MYSTTGPYLWELRRVLKRWWYITYKRLSIGLDHIMPTRIRKRKYRHITTTLRLLRKRIHIIGEPQALVKSYYLVVINRRRVLMYAVWRPTYSSMKAELEKRNEENIRRIRQILWHLCVNVFAINQSSDRSHHCATTYRLNRKRIHAIGEPRRHQQGEGSHVCLWRPTYKQLWVYGGGAGRVELNVCYVSFGMISSIYH